MCGICGLIDYSNSDSLKEGLLLRMCEKLSHRGPDGQGVFIKRGEPSVGLGHRRLSIIDLSEAGRQPMSNEDGAIHVVFNGEIYNYQELRKDLEAKGHIFKSKTDTETLIHLYEEIGPDCITSIRGMFAFALWDARDKLLLLARDRVGKKPLLYTRKNNKFCFASEFSSLLESGEASGEIRQGAVDHYLTYGYIPAPLTIYKDVFKLPPAHRLILKDNNLTIDRYWELDYSRKIRISEDEAALELLRLLREAVKIRLYSDVELGAFLSGGIDSSTIVALMSEVSTKKVKTFSIGFDEKPYSELAFAKRIADRYSTDHHEFIVKPDALKILPVLIERYGEPYADSSCIPTYYVCQQTRQFVKVALNGDGGDESFAGYERYQAMMAAEIFQKSPFPIRVLTKQASRLLPDSLSPNNNLRRIKRFLNAASLPLVDRYTKWVGIFDTTTKNGLYTEEYAKSLLNENKGGFLTASLFQSGSKDLSLLDRLLRVDVCSYLPEDLLVKVDIASMAHSLEARSPFLDHKVMEFAARLPSGYKIKTFAKKHILKKAIKNLIPRENIYRKKMGFGAPISSWLRVEMSGFLKDCLLSQKSLSRGYFKPQVIKNMVMGHLSGKKDHSFQLWSLLMLELWHRRFKD